MDEAEARVALATVGLSPTNVTPVVGGWANFTFDLDGELMVRFPSSEGVAESTQRELRLLPSLGRAVDFAIPQPVQVGEWNGWAFFTYRKISGRPLQPADDSPRLRSRLAEILGQLHSFPIATAAELLGVSDPITA